MTEQQQQQQLQQDERFTINPPPTPGHGSPAATTETRNRRRSSSSRRRQSSKTRRQSSGGGSSTPKTVEREDAMKEHDHHQQNQQKLRPSLDHESTNISKNKDNTHVGGRHHHDYHRSTPQPPQPIEHQKHQQDQKSSYYDHAHLDDDIIMTGEFGNASGSLGSRKDSRRLPRRHSSKTKTNYCDANNNSGPTSGISSRMLLSSGNNSSDDGSVTNNNGDENDDDDINNDIVSIGSKSSTQRRKWTRSLSPRRTATDLHDSFREKVISPAVNSLRKLKTRTRAWSQSPVASRGKNQHTQLSAGRDDNNNQKIADVLSIAPPLTNDSNSNDDDSGNDDKILRDGSDAVALALAAAANRHKRNDNEQTTSLSTESLVVPSRREDDDPTRPRGRSSRGIRRSKSDSHKQCLKQSKQPKPNQSSLSSKKTDSATLERPPHRDRRPSSSSQSRRSRRQDHKQRQSRSGKREAQSKHSSKNAPSRFASSTDGVVEASSNLKQQMLIDKMNRSHNDIDYLRLQAMMSTTGQNKRPTEEEEKADESDNESSQYEIDSSDSSIDNQPPPKPASDPGKLTSSRNRATTTTVTTNSRSKLPPSSIDPSSLSSHNLQKPASDPGLRKSSGSRTQVIVDRTPHQPKTLPASGRRNLDKDTLKNVQDVKDSIRQMRMERFAQRDKGKKVDSSKVASVTRPGLSHTTKTKHPPQSPASSKSTKPSLSTSTIASLQNATLASSSSSLPSKSQTSTQLKPAISYDAVGNSSFSSSFRKDDLPKTSSSIEQQKYQQQLLFNTSSSRLVGGITMDDLEVGHLKTNRPTVAGNASFSSLPVSAPIPPSLTNNIQNSSRNAASDLKAERMSQMTKSIRKTKRQIKRTCRDVWTERDEIVHLQRRNWSVRKSLLKTEAPKDSVTTLNLKLERTLQREGEAAVQLDAIRQKKRDLEKDCSNLTQKVSQFTKLLDSLNEQVVPLLPAVDDNVDSVGEYNELQPAGAGAESPLTVGDRIAADSRNRAAALVMNLLDPDEFSDSINSTEGEIHPPQSNMAEAELEPSLSLRHLRA